MYLISKNKNRKETLVMTVRGFCLVLCWQRRETPFISLTETTNTNRTIITNKHLSLTQKNSLFHHHHHHLP